MGGSVFFKKNFIPTKKKLPLTFLIVLGTVRKPDVGPLFVVYSFLLTLLGWLFRLVVPVTK
jgi:hypothetical protein